MSYYADRSRAGRALVLLHSINAAASAFEMKPLFERFRTSRPVYAPDLPRFGFSERANRGYSPGLYTSATTDFLSLEIRRTLTLISPTGCSRRHMRTGTGEAFFRVVSVPLWSQAFYDLLVTRRSIRYYLGKSFEGPIDQDLAGYDYATAHQPGARYAPLYFVSGKLFTPEAVDIIYEKLRLPVLVLYDRDGYTDFDRLPGFAKARRNWNAVRIPGTMGLPHFEKPEEKAAALERFWAERAAA